ncbi:MAG TPA: hypothetical protein VNZ67_11755 [bacterium]|jgi:hypothetical protein|nr:hypothetical protein [bacterium]
MHQVVIRDMADYKALLCLDPAKPIPTPPCDFSTSMLVGEPWTATCNSAGMSYPTVCYYTDKVVLTLELDNTAVTPGGAPCNSIAMKELYFVMPKSYQPFSVSVVARTL